MKKAIKVLTMVLILAVLIPTSVFGAEAQFLNVKEDWLRAAGSLEITNFDSEILELKDTTINIKSNEEGYEQTPKLTNAVTVLNSTTIVLNMEEPTYCEINVYKVNKEQNTYTYDFKKPLPITSGKVIDDPDMLPTYEPGVTLDILEEGEYIVQFVLADPAAITQQWGLIKVVSNTEGDKVEDVQEVKEGQEVQEVQEVEKVEEVTKVTATPTASKVLVNGKEVSFEAYNIDGNNYFKLRDLAQVVSETEKQFQVGWDNENKVINLISNESYTSVGAELAAGDGIPKEGILNTSKIYKDGQEINLTAYNINGNNYFKLRDVTEAFNIGVTWDSSTSTVGIDTTIDYIK